MPASQPSMAPPAARLSLRDLLRPSPEVVAALAEGRPVVALESTLISHGLPHPRNVEVAAMAEAAVRAAGAVPATIAVHDGRILVGLDEDELHRLATAPGVDKVSRHNLAAVLSGRGWGATTVSATMIAAHAAGIEVFATGGIGGVHRGALAGSSGGGATAATFDISADLEELARTPVAVVCAGPKAILDVPSTLEYLETRGVPVITIGQPDVPGFYSRTSGMPSPSSVPDVTAAAPVVDAHLRLGLGGGLLVCVPVPEDAALAPAVAHDAVERAVAEAHREGIQRGRLTPWLLARIAQLTDGASVGANVALIVNDARIAGEIAVQLAR